jgi:nicotinate-nucleotide--dimethylbenzimidazole phosphoribosyltransferase
MTVPASPADRPLAGVVLDAATLVNPPEPGPDGVAWPRPGARRLVAALASRGVAVHVPPAGDDPGAAAAMARHLADAGFPAGAIAVGTPGDGDVGRRTLVVTRRPDPDPPAALAGAPVVVCGDRPVHRAVLGWLAAEAGPFEAAALVCGPPDERAAAAARDHQLRLTKPPGSLGRLEDIGARLAGLAGTCPPPLPRPAAVAVFAGDHGVHAQGVSPWPQEVTAQMVGNLLDGGAAINVLARQAGADVAVVDIGVATPLDPRPGLVDARVRPGTADLTVGPAMTRDEARQALDAGAATAVRLVEGGAACLLTGDMGIANTTPSAALVASLTDRPAAEVTGRGTGIDDELLTRKTALVAAAAARARYDHGDDALAILAEVGGLEHAAIAGLVVGAAALQVPVIVDGVIAASALLVASRLVPGVEACVIAGHRSVEPGSSAVLDDLGLHPVIDLDLRLGEGTGAALALPVVEAAVRVLREMATFDEAGVSDKR